MQRICFLLRVKKEQWQRDMAPFFENEAGLASDRQMAPLEEVFHLD